MQTLFYGIFPPGSFGTAVILNRATASIGTKRPATFSVPILRKLFRDLTDPDQLKDWNLDEVFNWTAGVLNRVDRADFLVRFQENEAVQYFYEPFLEAFDPGLRKQLGVWYTPPEIVKYMVARVDKVLPRTSADRMA